MAPAILTLGTIDLNDGHVLISPLPKREKRRNASHSGISGAVSEVCISIAIATLPLIIFVTLFLCIVFSYQVTIEDDGGPAFWEGVPANRSAAFYVDFSATKLATIASWASSIAALLPGVVMTLHSYHIAHEMLRSDSTSNALPSPYQLALLMESLDGRITSFYNLLRYFFWKTRERVNLMMKSSFAIFGTATFIAYAIWATDTWLHVSTKTVAISVLSTKARPTQSFGFGTPNACVGFYKNMMDPSAVRPPGCYSPYYYCPEAGCGSAYDILTTDSVSPTQVLQSKQNGQTFSFLAPRNTSNMDYSATTVAVIASCQPISRQCGMTSKSWGFNCTSAFNGDIGGVPKYSDDCYSNGNGCTSFFTNTSFTTKWKYQNPAYMGVFGDLPTLGSNASGLSKDPDMFTYVSTVNAFVLSCEIRINDLNYTLINGTVGNASLSMANNDTAILATRALYWGGLSASQFSISAMTSVLGAKSMRDVATRYEDMLSRNIMAFAATAFVPRLNLAERTRQPMLVAQVPKAPLYALITLCILFVALGLALGSSVLWYVGPRRVRDVQARLNVYGVLASRFESQEREEAPVTKVEDLFEERDVNVTSSRVTILPSEEGGWRYAKIQPGMEFQLSTLRNRYN